MASPYSLAGGTAGRTRATLTASLATLGDTWLWTANGSTEASTPGPPPRSGGELAFDPADGLTMLFGGEATGPGPLPEFLADTWAWNGRSWRRLAPVASPPARTEGVLAADESTGGLVLFGGSSLRGALDDTWTWNGKRWVSARPGGAVSARLGAATAFDLDTDKLLVFGGVGPTGVTLGDTVMLSGTAPVALGTGAASSSSLPSAQGPGSGASPLGNATPPGSTTSLPAQLPAHVGLSPFRGVFPPLQALHRGDLVTLTGKGFAPRASITISFHSNPVNVGKAVTDERGDFSATVSVPDSASAGTHRFEATGRGPTGTITELIATVNIVGVPGSGVISSTQQRLVLTLVAVLIPATTWLALVVLGRWRRRRVARSSV